MPLKSTTELLEGDQRQRYFLNLNELHTELNSIVVSPAVPENVRSTFDTARNLALCSWFVYEFHSMADLAGFLALETAIKTRARSHSTEVADERSFRRLLRKALDEEWIAEDRIDGRLEIARMRVEQRKAIESIERMKELKVDSISIPEATEDEIEREAQEMKIIESTCEAAIKLRNAFAHGELSLDPGSWRRLRIVADLINQLFDSSESNP